MMKRTKRRRPSIHMNNISYQQLTVKVADTYIYVQDNVNLLTGRISRVPGPRTSSSVCGVGI